MPEERKNQFGTNFEAASVDAACAAMVKAGPRPQVMIDFSHANSSKQHRRQIVVGQDVGGPIAAGNRIMTALAEGHTTAIDYCVQEVPHNASNAVV